MLIAVDGPNGVGKTTFIDKLNECLLKEGLCTYVTKEPTRTMLGDFVRMFAEEENNRTTVAYLVAADRYNHFHTELKTLLEQPIIIICDRYIMSSFILQGMDGVEEKIIAELNDNVKLPDLQVVLTASEKMIRKRLCERDIITRYEKDNPEQEILYTEKAYAWIVNHGVKTIKLKNENNEDLEKNVRIISNIILKWEH